MHCNFVFFQSIGPVVGQSSPAVMDAVCLSIGCVMASMTVGTLVTRMDVVRHLLSPTDIAKRLNHIRFNRTYGKLGKP